MIDIHCHILPEVDDGAKSWDIAASMCRMAAADGIEHIVATPHANERYTYNRAFLAHKLDQLRCCEAAPGLSLGCDFHLSYENVQDALIRPEYYSIAGTQYLLVELSNFSIPAQIEATFSQMSDIGITPIITHPERNPILQQTPQRVLRWAEMGCAVQMTASALNGYWGDRVSRAAEWLLKREAVHVLATDAHDLEKRKPILSEGRDEVAAIYGEDIATALVNDNPHAILAGQALPYFPNPVIGR
jgi:protein-tyrosine phosphatase